MDFSESLHGTIQWIAREHAGDFFEQNLEWAFLRWTPSQDLSIRFGRTAADLFLLSNYRNVGYASPWLRPPHEFYSTLPVYHLDGIDITQKWQVDQGSLALKVFSGYSFNQLPTLFEPFDVKSSLSGINFNYEKGNWHSRIGYSYMHVLDDPPVQQLQAIYANPLINTIWPGASQLNPYLNTKNSDLHFLSLGATYDDGVWLAQAEVAYLNSPTRFSPSSFLSYLSLGRRIKTVTVYTLLGLSHSFQNAVTIPQPLVNAPIMQTLAGTADNLINGLGNSEKSFSFGLRWDFYDKMAFKCEWDQYYIDQNGAGSWIKTQNPSSAETVNVWSFGVDFVF